MLTHHRKPVCLSLISTDLPVWSVVETAATLYQKDRDRFHLLLTAPSLQNCEASHSLTQDNIPFNEPANHIINHVPTSPRILWLEISPHRIIMTMQGNGQLSYRHFWEQGVYGMSRYWLPTESVQHNEPIRLRNYTRSITLDGHPLPEHLQVEYELWAGVVQLGNYILDLEVKH